MKKGRGLISKYEKWTLVSGSATRKRDAGSDEIIRLLLSNRGIRTKRETDEFFNPLHPEKIDIRELGINGTQLKKGLKRLKKALGNKEQVVIFGDYDVDGITSSAILWEYLYGVGMKVIPYIPERFSEGYGIKVESILKLKKDYPDLSLIITVDNGILAHDAVTKARDLGVDTIILDHHEKGENYPNSLAIIHTTKLCGAGIAWTFVREANKVIRNQRYDLSQTLELAAMGTIADQMTLTGVNRSIVKYGLMALNSSKRTGINSLISTTGLKKGNIGIYEINYVLAPRINAMGRLEHAIDSLRLICTKNKKRADDLALLLNSTNLRRQKVVDEVLLKAKTLMSGASFEKIIVLGDKSYHEGVIGLAASKLTDEFFRPSIVISQGDDISKGSARSIPGFNIISAIRSADKLLLSGGGHEMAAGFSIKSKDIGLFKEMLVDYTNKHLGSDLLEKKLKIDTEIYPSDISHDLAEKLRGMEPFGTGNPAPTFLMKKCVISDVKKVGTNGNHIKFKLTDGGVSLDAIIFNSLNDVTDLRNDREVDIVFYLDENYWNGFVNLQLKIKDLKYSK